MMKNNSPAPFYSLTSFLVLLRGEWTTAPKAVAHRAPTGLSPPSQTPRCRFPAAGSSSRTLRVRPDMADPRRQQRMTSKELGISPPRQPVSARAAIEPLPPDPDDTPIELQKALRVCRSAVVLVVA